MTYAQLVDIFDILLSESHAAVIACLSHMPLGASYDDVAKLFRDRLPEDIQAELLNAMLSASDNVVDDGSDGWLNIHQAEIADTLFDSCMEIFAEEVIELAVNSGESA